MPPIAHEGPAALRKLSGGALCIAGAAGLLWAAILFYPRDCSTTLSGLALLALASTASQVLLLAGACLLMSRSAGTPNASDG